MMMKTAKTKKKSVKDLNLNGEKKLELVLDIGISETDRKKITASLNKALAETYCLMLKTQNYHWNVVGSEFRQIHLLTEEHYNNLFIAVDDLAERIRSLGAKSPGTMKEFEKLSDVKDGDSNLNSSEMVADLLKGHETIAKTLRNAIPTSDDAGDDATSDLLTARLNFHEKTAWMLRATLEK